ncbi:hypothetical protein CHARACLAT_021091 [Characodon lateralis]|uniref:Uncharacterized protein n=1 Tax=Characodon lateralis TaxID=208331 RepID=A0ABU7EL33_9TELE|nr:hypothetical protein [Characodon lateralis]
MSVVLKHWLQPHTKPYEFPPDFGFASQSSQGACASFVLLLKCVCYCLADNCSVSRFSHDCVGHNINIFLVMAMCMCLILVTNEGETICRDKRCSTLEERSQKLLLCSACAAKQNININHKERIRHKKELILLICLQFHTVVFSK